jgi:addiction module HigA family antidote
MEQKKQPQHPGKVLQKEYLEPLGISRNRLAMALHVPPPRLNDIVLGRRGITADTALRLAKGLGTSPQFWMTLQMDYELAQAQEELGDRLEQEVRPISRERATEADDRDIETGETTCCESTSAR